jgi:hypothetical protein
MNTFEGGVDAGIFKAGDIVCVAPGIPDGPAVLGIRPEQVEIVDSSAADATRSKPAFSRVVAPITARIARRSSEARILS